MVHGYFTHFSGKDINVYSAGTHPSPIQPHTITVMAEDGIDISHHTSNHMNEYLDITFDIVLTVCDNAQKICPVYPGKGKMIHHHFPDPYGHDLDEYRRVRKMIKKYCRNFKVQMELLMMNYLFRSDVFRILSQLLLQETCTSEN